jgi:ABC-type phosphate transport system auxiliary subunit
VKETQVVTTSIIALLTLMAVVAMAGLLVLWVDYLDRKWQLQKPTAHSECEEASVLSLWADRN